MHIDIPDTLRYHVPAVLYTAKGTLMNESRIAASSPIPVVLSESRPFLYDGMLLALCRERLAPDCRGHDLISVANLKHFLKNADALDAFAAHARNMARSARVPGVLVVTNGGSHKKAVRLLRSRIPDLRVTGVTVADRGARRSAAALVSWSDSSLHGTDRLTEAATRISGVTVPPSLVTLPTGLRMHRGRSVWLDVLISGLRHLAERGLSRVLLLGDVLKELDGTLMPYPVGNVIMARDRITYALPKLRVSIIGYTRNDHGYRLRVFRGL